MSLKDDLLKLHENDKKQRRSDDIVDWIRDNASRLRRSKHAVYDAERQLQQQGLDLTVDNLCDQLGLPDNLYFKRVVFEDNKLTLWNLPKSPLIDVFKRCRKHGGHKELAVVAVSGKHSMVATNMQVHLETAPIVCYIKDPEVGDIYVFPAVELQERLPNLT